MAHGMHPHRDVMESYISGELIDKLREEQRSLRRNMHALESDLDALLQQFCALRALYESHERLVGALLEAVEPDDPFPRARGQEEG
jgi:hypothetical protein